MTATVSANAMAATNANACATSFGTPVAPITKITMPSATPKIANHGQGTTEVLPRSLLTADGAGPS